MKTNNVSDPDTKRQRLDKLIEKKLKEMVNGSITIIVQDNRPIQININQNTLI